MSSVALSAAKTAELPEQVQRRGLNEAQWRTLCNNLYPGANPNSVLMVVDYCAARRLDPLKKPCHIVPMEVKDAKSGQYAWRDVVMPGIYELRTTAIRTEEYLGHEIPDYGEEIEYAGVKAPAWCEFTVKRWNGKAQRVAEFPVRVMFAEVVATKKDGKANARWARAPFQMLTKCAEAASLREAFPDELGGQQTFEEMDGQRAADAVIEPVEQKAKPANYDEWLESLKPFATKGEAALQAEFAKGTEACRDYLTTADTETWELLKNNAIDAEVS